MQGGTRRFIARLLLTSIQDALAKRGTFIAETALMLANNLTFFVLWILFFQYFEEIRGWRIEEVSLVLSMLFFGWGFFSFFLGGTRTLSKKIIEGEIDSLLVLPKPVLMHLMLSKCYPRGMGHIASSVALIFFAGSLSPFQYLLLLLSMATSVIIFTSFTIIVHSIVFYLGPMDKLPSLYCDTFLLFAGYPSNIYPAYLQMVMYTLIPAGLIGSLPVFLIKEFTVEALVVLLCSAGLFAFTAKTLFYKGLSRYSSGSFTGFQGN